MKTHSSSETLSVSKTQGRESLQLIIWFSDNGDKYFRLEFFLCSSFSGRRCH